MDVDSAPAPVEKTYDVCIIGAGPAGLSVLSALQNPEGILSSEAQWSQWKKAKEGGSGRELPSVCVIDPAGCWLSEWRGRFRSLGIKMLRSPAWATPDFFSTNAMCSLHTFAWEAGRQAELHELELPRKAKHLNRVAGTGMFQLPGSRLFEDFCDDLVAKLEHTFVPGAAEAVEKRGDGTYDVAVGGHAAPVRAHNVVFALGAAGSPTIPAPLSLVHERCAGARNPRVVHTYAWAKLRAAPFKGETVVVIGGGLSAAQAALLAVRRGASKVIHVSRRPMLAREYDLPIEWMEPRSGWRLKEKGGDNGSQKFRSFEFFETPTSERAEWAASARGGATVPASYLKELERAAKSGRLERWVDEVVAAEICDCEPQPPASCGCGPNDQGAIRIAFRNGDREILADRVVLATGSSLDVSKVPLLSDVAARYELPVEGNLPDIDTDLQWGDESFSVVGAFALLEVGPDSGNLTGCRRCAEICADKLGAFEAFTQVGGHLQNKYSVFAADSSSSSECESDSDYSD